ncbi:TPA: PBSX family phage terminase large subunit [Clostridioides difficile]|uniref:PBSX family phage terminase large subunit n=1 Tax=Clostridioides difficile TaxID=1496 RepID=UPI00038C9F48|nr:PBSX family phage terminase large subunit [Clostridioides difficile]EQK05156.1 phage terminase, large subunit, PBSX family [Clostridioides difficile P59]MDM9915779.1 PBSX family phage terminase large subunit [Clostridioides difficile]MDS6221860.1 PBSX family phage terminase large subunit [Clostridioides difficile]HBE8530146.1 PBSX family phage terminase large subunit [Clostridioides difficile]HBF2202912.1 PBSX family phage terminase large subunit [Clostridioides difficile]
MNKKLSEIINKNFYEFWKVSNSNKYLYHVLKGGRASAKSTHIAFWLTLAMVKYPVNTVCFRKVGNTIMDSVYEQLKETIEIFGLTHLFQFKKSPMEIIFIPRGNKFIFRGLDDPQKIKSIKSAKYPIAFAWFEEVAEIKTEDELSMVINSVLRGELPNKLNYKIFLSYNPPKRKQSWVNKKFETHTLPKNTYVHHSIYLDNPHISKAFIEEANEIKIRNEFKYRWEYLGEPIGSGVVPFSNLEFKTITNEEIFHFDNIRQGNDFGYATDPMAFVRLHYDKKKRIIYFIDEIFGVKMSIRELASKIKSKGYDDFNVVCDSAEPRSIAELREYGIRALKAKKGPGSIEFGENWLDDLQAIVIDPNRTPNVAREFENIDYQTDKDGNVRAKLEDKDNHSIDATRYALELDMKTHGRERQYNSR